MNPRTLPLKRKPAPQGLLKKLSASIPAPRRKQRVAATAQADDMELEDGSRRIARALMIIFLIHVLAVALIIIHQKYLEKHSPKPVARHVATPAPARRDNLPILASGDRIHSVQTGDTYERIAARYQVDQSELRGMNNHTDLIPGIAIRVPKSTAPAPAIQSPPPQVAPSHNPSIPPVAVAVPEPGDDLMPVASTSIADAPRALAVRPAADSTRPPTSGRGSYTVRKGDTFYAIARRHGCSPQALMRANRIKDPSKLRIGATLTIP